MIGFIIFAVFLFSFGIAAPALFFWHRHRRLDSDPGRVLFEKVEELLQTRAGDWLRLPPVPFRDGYHLPGANVSVFLDWIDERLTLVVADEDGRGTPKIKPSRQWERRLKRALAVMRSLQSRADQLNAICDAVEGLAANNVIPMRKGNR